MRSLVWLLGYSDAALADAERGLRGMRSRSDTLASLLHASAAPTLSHRGNYANELLNELSSLATEKSASLWKAQATILRGRILALTGEASDAVQMITSGLTALRATGTTSWEPHNPPGLARRKQSQHRST